jgi:uncharacterized protein (DUF433 family)
MLKQDIRARLGTGLYSIPDAARIIKSTAGNVRRLIDSDHSAGNGRFDPQGRTVTFLELMELQFIKLFRDEGVGLDTIRKAAKTAARQFGTSYPFAVHRFDTDGRTVFATLLSGEKQSAVIEDLRHGQYVFETIVRPFFKKLEYGADLAIRFWPMGIKDRVVLDPERQFGKPIDNETAVPTAALYRAVKAGEDPVAVAKWFEVPLAAVRAAVTFEDSLTA